MYRPLYQAMCGERRAAGRGEETCGWEAGRDSKQNVPAVLGWPQVQAGHWHRSGDTQAGHLWENHPWVGMCKRQEVPVARLFQVWIQKSSARSMLLWNLPRFVWKEQKIKLRDVQFSVFMESRATQDYPNLPILEDPPPPLGNPWATSLWENIPRKVGYVPSS